MTEPDEPHASRAAERSAAACSWRTVAGGVSSLVWGKVGLGPASRGGVAPVEGLSRSCPTGGWRIYTVSGSMPTFDAATWRLAGRRRRRAAAQPLLRRAALAAARGAGLDLPLRHRLDGAERPLGRRAASPTCSRRRARAGGARAEFVSAEIPYADYLTLQQASLHDVMLAYEMDGKPLPREHGAPLRLVIPDMYGYKNVKWLSAINARPRGRRTATGSSSATTATPGSAARTGTAT